jgi:hypothetical protein
VDRQPPTIVELKNDNLKQVRLPIGAKNQRPPRFVISLLERIAGERMLDRVKDVFIRDTVLARCGVNLHTRLLYYKTPQAKAGPSR